MKHSYFLNFLIFILPISGFAQIGLESQTISSTSNSFSNNNIRIDWTIGELAAVTTLEGDGFIFTQGLHQPDKFTVGINDLSKNSFSVNLYPNPAVDQISLDLIGNIGSNITVQIYDATGRLVSNPSQVNLNQPVTNTIISIGHLAQGAYFIHLSSVNKNFRTAIGFVKTFAY